MFRMYIPIVFGCQTFSVRREQKIHGIESDVEPVLDPSALLVRCYIVYFQESAAYFTIPGK